MSPLSSSAPLSEVTVWVRPDVFVQVTGSPVRTVTDADWKAKSTIETSCEAALTVPAAAANRVSSTPNRSTPRGPTIGTVTDPRGPMPPLRLVARWVTVLLAILCVWIPTASARAASPAPSPLSVVPDHVLPGETFTLVGAGLSASAELVLRLRNDSRAVELGRARAAADGSLATMLRLPDDFPLGEAKVVAAVPGGLEWSATFVVGPRPEPTGLRQAAAFGSGVDWNLVAIGLMAVFVIGVGVGLYRLVWLKR
jgi:hypothetical protein